MTFADLRALHAIIGSAIDDIERIYRPPSTDRRASQSSASSSFRSSSSSNFQARSPSKPRSSLSTDSDIEEEDDDDADADMPLTPVSASNSQPGPNNVRFASTGRKGLVKGRERSYTMGSLPQPPFSPPGVNASVPLPILKQPALDFPDLDTPIPITPTSSSSDTSAPMSTSTPSNVSSSPKIPISPTLTVELEKVGAGASTLLDPTQRQREWRKKCEDLTTHPEVIKAVNRIVAACGQMSAMVQKPFLVVCDAAMGYNLPACLRFLEAAHMSEMLREVGPRGLSSREIAEKIQAQLGASGEGKGFNGEKTVVDSTRISHVLRLLATHHITREVRPDVFANNRISSVIDSGKSWQELVDMKQSPERKYEGTDGIAAFVGLCTDELFKASAYLADCYLLPPSSPSSPPTPSSSPQSPPLQPHSCSPQSPAPTTTTPIVVPPHPRPSMSAPAGDVSHLGMVTPNDSTSSLGSVVEEERRGTEDGSSPMRFAQNPHPTPAQNRQRKKSSGWSFSNSNDTPRRPATPPTPQSLPNAHKKPGILKRLSSRTFSRTPTPTTTPSDAPPLPSMPGTPRSAAFEAPETPRSRTSSTTSLIGQRLVSIPASPDTLRSPATSGHAYTFSDLLKTPKSAPRHAKMPSQDLNMLNTPRSTPSRQSSHSESNVAPATPKWTPSRESLRALGTKGSFASLKTGKRGAEPLHQTYAELLDAAGDGNGLLGPAFDLRPSVLAVSPRAQTFSGSASSPLSRKDDPLPPVPPLHISSAPPPVPPKSPLRSPSDSGAGSPGALQANTDGRKARRGRAASSGLQPGDEMYAPFNIAFGTRLRYFEWLERGENVFRLRRFGKAMTGTEKWEVPGSIVGGFPWHELPPRSVVVDVGGGIGSTSMLLANAFPHLRFVIQDRPPVVEMGTAAWRSRYPELLDSGRATFQAHDFFKPQPALPLAILASEGQSDSMTESNTKAPDAGDVEVRPAVFLMRVITHDWPDSYIIRILLRLRQAAGPNTRLLLADYVLPLACVDEDEDGGAETPDSVSTSEKVTYEPLPGAARTLAPEGSPLLPNLGKANANAYWLDLTMRAMFNAQERTLRELAALARAAGWKVVQVTHAEGSLFGHITAMPVDIPEETLALPDESESEESTGPDEGASAAPDALPSLPPMGDTFLSSVELPSETAIRAGVASGSGRLRGARGDAEGKKGAGRRRARAYTFTGRDSRDRDRRDEGRDASERGAGGEVRKGLRTIMKMLSKAHLRGDVPPEEGEREENAGPLALSRQRTRT
ncbi:uncharacterized protein PHACADRAFT_210808 [Phanerochaete carnosa HHB-10118-sp]|uniref:O-methyltransferase C-terminal domain-containing protein n=1 Tax=Phanerochaete carnosa (strain HHB-10118-sp) TaxID=650164 RepID=K5VNN2_PHACS|nr:uncharacterized protein PHACADRAFT_210808 [Phanerochaete carnosa HHB-10118-sp]EKM53088.1 hypothetical protein PHACADRAFT_210808 [Phanerochaete carnosa HHB-10118-sp]